MEKIYPPSRYRCSEPIILKQYFEVCTEDGLFNGKRKKVTEDQRIDGLLDELNITDVNRKEEMQEFLRKYQQKVIPADPISLKKSRKKSKKSKLMENDILDVPNELKCLRIIRARIQFQEKVENMSEQQQRPKENDFCLFDVKPHKNKKANIEPGQEFAVAIRIYYPFDCDFQKNSFTNLRFSHEIIVLGSNTLADLRDTIKCRADLGVCREVEDPNMEIPITRPAKEIYPSGFIFMDNVFYNDMRHPAAVDYSETIRNWAKKSEIEIEKTGEMTETKINELTPRFGYPYLYQHQADCEHILCFSDVQIVGCNDPLNSEDYPYIRSVQRLRSKQCILCYKQTAKWIVHNSERIPHSEGFVCHKCLLEYCYRDGEKMDDFKLYPYYDETCPVESR